MTSPRRIIGIVLSLLALLLVASVIVISGGFLDVHPFFGSRVAFIGDVDGDGVPDFAVGDDGWGSGRAVTVISGRRGRVLYHVSSGAKDTAFSETIAAVGDLDRDGVPDFAVGARLAHRGEWTSGACPYAGEVWLVSGRGGKVLRVIDGRTLVDDDSTADGRAGSALAGAGDIDRDGIPDVAIGLPETGGSTGLGRARGLVVVVSGRDGRVLRRLEPSGDDREFGHALAGGLEFDGDGVPDLAVGIPGGKRLSYTGDGRVRLFSGKAGQALWAVDGGGGKSREGESMGNQLIPLPDIDKDGTPDVLSAGGSFGRGRILAISGRDGHPIREWRTPPEHESFQGAVAALPDRDGDGVPEVVYSHYLGDGSEALGASEVIALSSRTEQPLWRFEGTAQSLVCTLNVAVGGDLDGDGVPDVVVGELGIHGSRGTSGKVHALSGKDGHTIYVVSGGRK
jgi:hypothetical protein